MKISLLALVVLAMSIRVVCADAAVGSRLVLASTPVSFREVDQDTSRVTSLPSLTLAAGEEASTPGFKLDTSSAHFAELSTAKRTPLALPLSSGLGLTLLAGFVLALRIMGLNHARAMADHERESYQGKARMFRSLHEGGADH